MSRHSAPGTDGAYGDETWLPGGSSAEPADGATGRRRQPARHAADPQYLPGDSAPDPFGADSPTGPPWEHPGWDATGSSLPTAWPLNIEGDFSPSARRRTRCRISSAVPPRTRARCGSKSR